MWTFKKKIYYLLYSLLAKKLPLSRRCKLAKKIRNYFASHILNNVGKNINIEKNAEFNPKVSVGDNSGIGVNCELYGEVQIGNNVLMGPECIFYTSNHNYINKNELIINQGSTKEKKIIIEDDVWIGSRVIILPGVTIKKGCVIGAGSIVTKNFPEYSVICGNPAKVVKFRKEK